MTGAAKWQGDGCFGWVVRRFNDRVVAFVGCRPAFWGDIAEEVVHYLASSWSVREILYFGKLGSVNRGIEILDSHRPYAYKFLRVGDVTSSTCISLTVTASHREVSF